jgi:DNA adenine methylase
MTLGSSYSRATPFLKWAGGKRWLAQNYEELVPRAFNVYREPFLGGGAMFFAIRPQLAVLSDTNAELMACYRQMKRAPRKLLSELEGYSRQHSADFYYDTRATVVSDPIAQAARFLYLNRACFNGIYRVNLKGVFNVPKGNKSTIIFPFDDFSEVSQSLKSATLIVSDFEDVIDDAKRGDFCFCDPPYTVTHNENGFIKYNEYLFGWADQLRLKKCLMRAHKRGVFWLSTNAEHTAIRNLYSNRCCRITAVSRRSVIGGTGAVRGRYGELLISNYPINLDGQSQA